MSTDGPRFTFDPAGHGRRVDVSSRPRLLSIAFAALWLSGWLLLLTLAWLEFSRFGRVNFFGIALLVFGGGPVALALLWVAGGKRESLTVTGDATIRIERRAGPFVLSRMFAADVVRAIGVAEVTEGALSDLVAVRRFYSGGNGRLVLETPRGSYSFGHGLSLAAAKELVDQVRQLVPSLQRPSGDPMPSASRIAGHATVFMTMAMLGFALNVPVRLAITDRPICFYDEDVAPRSPIDVSRLPRGGQIYLVPLDDFPVERAQVLAEHFRSTFDVPIAVAQPMAWPDGARDDSRRQMNAAAMLDRLEAAFPAGTPKTVAIALSMRDLFNPEVNWSYVFSYRRHGRVAVVSPARMDRGCMGLLPADDSRILSRLKKMVGKNIGIMYFGLEFSSDSASMLYGNIGGPQELDAMSERF